MQEKETRKRHSPEFKREAVLRVVEGNRGTTTVARELGIHPNLLHRWKRAYLDEQERSSQGKASAKTEAEEVRRLERQLADVTEERDILKKAVAIFSKHPK